MDFFLKKKLFPSFLTCAMTIQKNSEILVKVDEALPDLLVVSYFTEDKKYQGALLDTTKNNLPCGVYSLHPAISSSDDKLHSVSQRYAYQETQYALDRNVPSGRPSKVKLQHKQKMTVRLRPRKVLCSNCQGICNENSENVNLKRRKVASSDDNESVDIEKEFLSGSMLIPKLSRLHPIEISSALKGSAPKTDKINTKIVDKQSFNPVHVDDVIHDVAFVDINDKSDEKYNLRFRNEGNSFFRNAKTLKISYGKGEGTVVKIPPLADLNEDSGVCDMSRQTNNAESKAARRAKRKAKKLSKKNNTTIPSLKSSVNHKHIGALSPRNNLCDSTTNTAGSKLKHHLKQKNHSASEHDEENTKSEEEIEKKSPVSKNSANDDIVGLDFEMGNHPEGWEGDAAPDSPGTDTEGAAKTELHVSPGDIVWGKLVKYPWWPGRVISVTSSAKAHVAWYATSTIVPCDNIRPFLVDYKLIFNKKKRGLYKEAVKQATQEAQLFESQLNTRLLGLPCTKPQQMDKSSTKPDEEMDGSSNDNVGLDFEMGNHPEEWEGDAAPSFPVTGTESTVKSELKVSPGDIVWATCDGYPWWPGRVLSVKSADKAQVAWYATSTMVPFDNLRPFLEDFKLRFNKKKKGTYQEAVELATQEAQLLESQLHTRSLGLPCT